MSPRLEPVLHRVLDWVLAALSVLLDRSRVHRHHVVRQYQPMALSILGASLWGDQLRRTGTRYITSFAKPVTSVGYGCVSLNLFLWLANKRFTAWLSNTGPCGDALWFWGCSAPLSSPVSMKVPSELSALAAPVHQKHVAIDLCGAIAAQCVLLLLIQGFSRRRPGFRPA